MRKWIFSFVIVVLAGRPVEARSPYEVDLLVDGLGTASLFLFVGFLDGMVKPSLESQKECPEEAFIGYCDPEGLNPLDRTVVGNRSAGWRHISDMGALGAYGLPIALGALDYYVSGERGFGGDLGKDLLVATEAVGMTVVLTDLFKYAVRRPRPTRYDSNVFSGSFEHSLSFPSGHTASTAAAAAAGVTTFFLRHPRSNYRYGLAGLGAALTGLTAFGRVGGGMHFYSDVMAGAVLGAAMGVLIPYLHQSEGGGVSVAPLVGESSRGMILSFGY